MIVERSIGTNNRSSREGQSFLLFHQDKEKRTKGDSRSLDAISRDSTASPVTCVSPEFDLCAVSVGFRSGVLSESQSQGSDAPIAKPPRSTL